MKKLFPAKDPTRPAKPGGVVDIKQRLAQFPDTLELPIEARDAVRRLCRDTLNCLETIEREYWSVNRCCPRCGYQVPVQ